MFSDLTPVVRRNYIFGFHHLCRAGNIHDDPCQLFLQVPAKDHFHAWIASPLHPNEFGTVGGTVHLSRAVTVTNPPVMSHHCKSHPAADPCRTSILPGSHDGLCALFDDQPAKFRFCRRIRSIMSMGGIYHNLTGFDIRYFGLHTVAYGGEQRSLERNDIEGNQDGLVGNTVLISRFHGTGRQ